MIDYPRLQLAARLVPIAPIAIGFLNVQEQRLRSLIQGTNAEPFTLDTASLLVAMDTVQAPAEVRSAFIVFLPSLAFRYSFLDTVELPSGIDTAVLDALVTMKVNAATAGFSASLMQKMDTSLYDADNNGKVDAAKQQSLELLFSTPALQWVANHNLGRIPEVSIIDSTGQVLTADVVHPSLNTTIINFGAPLSGRLVFS